MVTARVFNNTDLEEIVNSFLNKMIEHNPALKPDIDARRENLVDTMCDLLSQRKDMNQLSDLTLGNKDFVKQLSLALASVVTMQKSFAADKNIFDQDLIKKLDKILSDPNKRKELEKDPSAIEKYLKPDELQKLQLIRESVSKRCEQLINDLEKLGLITPKPVPGKSAKEEMMKGFDRYENLFGLANSHITGSVATVVQSYMGNGLGFPDWNPNNGLANIDRINSVEDNQQADPLALNASTMGNFLQFIGDAFASEFQQDLQTQGLAASMTPRPHA